MVSAETAVEETDVREEGKKLQKLGFKARTMFLNLFFSFFFSRFDRGDRPERGERGDRGDRGDRRGGDRFGGDRGDKKPAGAPRSGDIKFGGGAGGAAGKAREGK